MAFSQLHTVFFDGFLLVPFRRSAIWHGSYNFQKRWSSAGPEGLGNVFVFIPGGHKVTPMTPQYTKLQPPPDGRNSLSRPRCSGRCSVVDAGQKVVTEVHLGLSYPGRRRFENVGDLEILEINHAPALPTQQFGTNHEDSLALQGASRST